MEKTYKVISSFGFKQVFIDHFSTLEAALDAHKKACEGNCEFSYLLETEVDYFDSKDSVNTILEVFEENG